MCFESLYYYHSSNYCVICVHVVMEHPRPHDTFWIYDRRQKADFMGYMSRYARGDLHQTVV